MIPLMVLLRVKCQGKRRNGDKGEEKKMVFGALLYLFGG
jgi:hypothetical protein